MKTKRKKRKTTDLTEEHQKNSVFIILMRIIFQLVPADVHCGSPCLKPVMWIRLDCIRIQVNKITKLISNHILRVKQLVIINSSGKIALKIYYSLQKKLIFGGQTLFFASFYTFIPEPRTQTDPDPHHCLKHVQSDVMSTYSCNSKTSVADSFLFDPDHDPTKDRKKTFFFFWLPKKLLFCYSMNLLFYNALL